MVENSIPVVVNGVTYNTHDTTFTHYLGGMVYQSKNYSNSTVRNNLRYSYQLQFFGHEEGRVRAVRATPKSNLDNLVYDYMLKDHLGNVRMVLTEEQQINRYPAATLEGTYGGTTNSLINHEAKFFNIDTAKITNESDILSWGIETGTTKDYFNHNGNPPANDQYPAGVSPASTARSSKLYRLNATENKTGLEFMLKVMAGDKVDIFGNSYYRNTGEITNNNSTPLDVLTILSAWLAVPGSGLAGKGLTAGQLNSLNAGLIPSTFIRGNNNESGQTIPKAYINYLFFDEQFQYVNGGFSRVGAGDTLKRHWYEDAALQNITVPKNGYIFVYVSNESNLNVFFDNVQVIHKPGALLEETHYYPFGLTMAGISSKAAGKLESNQKFTGQILDVDFGLNWYQFRFRTYDPQIGRFIQVDPLSSSYPHYSVYAYAGNDVVNSIDIEGLEPGPVRYMSPSFYTQQQRSYRQINSFVPRVTSYRNSGSFIPNQANFNPSRPANIYEDFTPGTGDQHNGPFITRNNTIGQLSVKLTELVDDLKSQIERVNVTTDNIFSSNGKTTLTKADIKWTNKEAEAKFNQAQGAYDNKVNEIRQAGNNRLPEPPGKNATSEEWRSYLQTMQTVMGEVSFQIALLGPSPTQQIINSTQQGNDFNRVNTTYTPLPEVGPAPQQRRQ